MLLCELPTNQVASLYREGKTLREISKKFGCSTALVCRALQEAGVARRVSGPPLGYKQSKTSVQRRAASNTKHGLSYTPEGKAFLNARHRCTNPKNRGYANYGGRGIKFLLDSPQQIIDAIGYRPPNKTLDRIDNDGHYEIGNIRWATRSEQQHNKRLRRRDVADSQILRLFDQGLTQKEIAETTMLGARTVYTRLKKLNLPSRLGRNQFSGGQNAA